MKFSGLHCEDATFINATPLPSQKKIKQVQKRIALWQAGNLPPFLTLPKDKTVLKRVKKLRKMITKRAKHLVVFGIGGSSLGGEMLVNGLKKKRGLPVDFYDNVDPDTLADLEQMSWKKTFLLVVSKSGGTAETLSQLLTTLPALQKQLGKKWARQVAVITEDRDGDLGKIAQELQMTIIDHPPVGGRFSALSVVGLLPAAVAGADIDQLMVGANTMMAHCLEKEIAKNPAFQGAIAQYAMAANGKNISVYMSYGQRLDRVAAWQSQLWGESLGKTDSAGKAFGLTPVAARGVTDQHSQLQLYLDGPADKQFTFFYDPLSASRGKKIGKQFSSLASVSPLSGRTTGSLFAAEFLGTRDALIHKKAPVRTLNIATGDSGAFGEMIILLESETVILAELFGIDAYDQPAVEDGKIRARDYLAQF
ncbi:MAG: glucose-6-phosphate isomerase [Magnetococcales bacterium]|nr:glucose-6-phosphate isomerase [Magnetococcales bacterium]